MHKTPKWVENFFTAFRYTGFMQKKSVVTSELLEKMRDSLPSEFQIYEVCRLLDVTPKTADEYLKQAYQDGWIERLGAGTNTRFRFIEPMYRAA